MDYKSLHDDYWKAGHSFAQSGLDDPPSVARALLSVAGYGKTLDVGSGAGKLVLELLSLGIDACGVDVAPLAVEHANTFAPGRFTQGCVLQLPFAENAFPVIATTGMLDMLREADVDAALREIWRVCSATVFVKVSTSADAAGRRHTSRPRTWWESRLAAAGFRKHPLAQSIVPCESLDTTQDATIIVEKVPAHVLAQFPLASIGRHYHSHADMTREVGRRSDQSIAHYMLATRHVRIGDVVLDVASGMGYGPHIIAHATGASKIIGLDSSPRAVAYAEANFGRADHRLSFRVGVPHDLSWLSDCSVDYVVAMETLDCLSEPGTFLTEARRVLRPSGRILVSVLQQPLDRKELPNPHHFDVYDLAKLRRQISPHFDLEIVWSQRAVGERPAGLSILDLSPTEDDASDAEWLLALAMKSPLSSGRVEYQETAIPQAERVGGHVAAFAKWYRNPWLVRGLVTRGGRVNSPRLLDSYARQLGASAAPDSADRGAGLCVLAYQLLDNRHSGGFHAGATALAPSLEAYLEFASSNPHVRRWQISCAYVLALLRCAVGDLAGAEKAFIDCTGRDPIEFSPLLATKTLSAHSGLAKIYLGRGDRELARKTLEEAIIRATNLIGKDWANVIGTHNDPYPFGLHELAEVADVASNCALMLEALNRGWSGPFSLARVTITHSETTASLRRALADREQHAQWYSEQLARLGATLAQLELIREERDGDVARLTDQVTSRDDRLAELNSRVLEHEQALRTKDADAANQTAAQVQEIEALSAAIADLQLMLQERAGDIARLSDDVTNRDGRLAGLNSRVVEYERALRSLDENTSVRERDHALHGAELRRLADHWELRAKALENSTSWKITTPLRAVSLVARGFLRRPAHKPEHAPNGEGSAARWRWRRSGAGHSPAQHIGPPHELPSVGASGLFRSWKVRAASARGARRFTEIMRSQGLGAALRAARHYVARRHFPHRLAPAMLLPAAPARSMGQPAAELTEGDAQPVARRAIAMLVETMFDGGVERVTIDLCLALKRKGYSPIILIANAGGRSAEEARGHGLAVVEFGGNRFKLTAWLGKFRPSALFTHHSYFELQQFRAAGVPIVEVMHNAYFWQVGDALVELHRRDNICEIVAVSDFVRDYAVENFGLDKRRIATIPNGLNIAGLIRPPIEIMTAQRLRTLDSPVLAFVANLHPQKNHRGVLRALPKILEAFPKARLKIAGALEGNAALLSRINADVRALGLQNTVKFLGPLDRRALSRLLAEAHIGLLPSRLEGFSIVTLEYAFFGLPSVLSATGAGRWLADEFGHCILASNCALPPEQLSAAAIDHYANGSASLGSEEIADAVVDQLKHYPEWLARAAAAAERSAAYAIDCGAEQYASIFERILSQSQGNADEAKRAEGEYCNYCAVSDRTQH